jgi:hypothetical protein
MSLFISSYDGSVTVCIFEEGDLGKALPLEENVQFLARYGHDRHGILLPESPAQLDLENRSKDEEMETEEKETVPPMQAMQTSSPALDGAPKAAVASPKPQNSASGTNPIQCATNQSKLQPLKFCNKKSHVRKMARSELHPCSSVVVPMPL